MKDSADVAPHFYVAIGGVADPDLPYEIVLARGGKHYVYGYAATRSEAESRKSIWDARLRAGEV